MIITTEIDTARGGATLVFLDGVDVTFALTNVEARSDLNGGRVKLTYKPMFKLLDLPADVLAKLQEFDALPEP